MSAFRLVLFLLALVGAGLLQAADPGYATSSARGLAIYKPHDTASDDTAILIEYRSFTAHDRISYLITAGGTRLTVPLRGASLLLLPYPGKGEATPQEALAVIAYAESRYPAYRAHIRPLKAAWIKESARPTAEIQKEVAAREKNKETSATFLGWLKSLTPRRPPPEIPPSPLGTPKVAASNTAKKTEAPEKPAEPAAATGEANPLDLKANLRKIQEFYGASQSLEEAQ